MKDRTNSGSAFRLQPSAFSLPPILPHFPFSNKLKSSSPMAPTTALASRPWALSLAGSLPVPSTGGFTACKALPPSSGKKLAITSRSGTK